jgi:hypothetical protein
MYGIGGRLVCSLPFADRARLSHYVCHNLVLPLNWGRLPKSSCRCAPRELSFADRPTQERRSHTRPTRVCASKTACDFVSTNAPTCRDYRFPVDPWQYPRILQHCPAALEAEFGEQTPDLLEFQSLVTAFGHLPRRNEVNRDRIAERNRDKEIHKRRLAELCARSPGLTACICRAVGVINGTPYNPASFEELHELIKT